MSGETKSCPICHETSRFVGTAQLKPANEIVQTPFFRCAKCDLFHRGMSQELLMANNDAAHYSNLDHEELDRGRRMGYYDVLLDLIESLMHPHPRSSGEPPRLLDVGCAYGHLIESAVQHGFVASGIDINERNVEFARSQGLNAETSLDRIEGDFDVITTIDTLYYVPDPMDFVAELLARLRPGGILIARVCNRNMEARWRCMRSKPADLRLFIDHTTGYSPRSMRRLLRSSGFTGVKVISESGRGKVLSKSHQRIYRQTSLLASLSLEKIILTPGFYGVGYRSDNGK